MTSKKEMVSDSNKKTCNDSKQPILVTDLIRSILECVSSGWYLASKSCIRVTNPTTPEIILFPKEDNNFENLIAVMRSDGFDYLREHCPSLQSEILKTVAGCEEELSGGGKTRSVWGQFSDGGGAETRQQATWGEINGGGGGGGEAERSQSVWVQAENANNGRNNINDSDDPMVDD